ncbi:hypothetical protein AVEN_153179-1 [Araneus ventricosus]|uniref:Uncharacterized protein n=1 Tax=Araneus ventricosus TaxID=182803 RepID=A0A4Y2L6L9_ARAVE|nr:hypothetical protein AVEN_153179-1 [Araneus ventricosus]
MDFMDLKSALAYSMKFEFAKTASKISVHAWSIKTEGDTRKERDVKFESLLKALEKLVNSLAAEQNSPRRNPNTAPNLTLKTATGEKAKIQGKLDAPIECGSRKFQHRDYVADITDSCILGLDFLQKFKFTVDLEKNEIRTGSEKISSFSSSTQYRKRISDGTDILSRRLCIEDCKPCSNAEKKFRMETDISVEALTMTTEDRWSLSEIQKAQLKDPDVRPILKMKLNSADRPSLQEIARESPGTK